MIEKAEIVEAGKELRLTRISKSAVPATAVRVKVLFAGLCHSDLHLLDDADATHRRVLGEKFRGLVLGHEIAGRVEEVGSELDPTRYGWLVGDHVVVLPWRGCRTCSDCLAGYNNQCENNPAGSMDVGQSPDYPGGFQSHIDLDPYCVIKVNPSLPLDVACMLPCSASTVYSGLSKLTTALAAGETRSGTARLLVIGAGGLGLWAIKLTSAIFSDRVKVIVADIDQSKLDLAKKAGAHGTILWNRDDTEDSKIITSKEGLFDAALDFVGSCASADIALHCLHSGSTLVVIGLFGGVISVPLSFLISRSLTVVGSRTCTRNQLCNVLDLATQASFTFPHIQYFTIQEINKAIDSLRKGKIQGRAVIKYDSD